MRAIVVFDSKYGNSELVARAVAALLESPEVGASVLVLPASEIQPLALDRIDLLVVGGPTQARGATSPLKEFLAGLGNSSVQGVAAATFDTRVRWPKLLSGSAAAVAAGHLRRAGCRIVSPPESFFVEGREGPLAAGELEHAAEWGRRLGRAMAGQPAAVSGREKAVSAR